MVRRKMVINEVRILGKSEVMQDLVIMLRNSNFILTAMGSLDSFFCVFFFLKVVTSSDLGLKRSA